VIVSETGTGTGFVIGIVTWIATATGIEWREIHAIASGTATESAIASVTETETATEKETVTERDHAISTDEMTGAMTDSRSESSTFQTTEGGRVRHSTAGTDRHREE
jgi:hypothetical protein